ncbi:MAG: hypothetical protein HQL25_08220 [Candidatus Omnitrophica bacterium]|nr:hypothetical protein [Candidatus Omnitrophota bacterium]
MTNEKMVRIIAVLMCFCAAPACLAALIAIVSGFWIGKIPLTVLVVFSPVLFLLCGFGLLKFNKWAKWLTVFLSPFLFIILFQGISLLIGFIFKNADVVIPLSQFVSAIFIFCVLFLLLSPMNKELFK